MKMNSTALIESKTIRENYMNRVDVLDKVKKLSMLPGDVNTTIELTAEYYEVGIEAIHKHIKNNRVELESDGLRVLKGSELMSLKDISVVGKNARAFTVIPRRAVLRIGMLLEQSVVAQAVRDYLLDTEEQAEHRQPDNPELIQFQKEQMQLEFVTKTLNVNDGSKIKMLEAFHKDHGLSTAYLPAYTEEQATKSATALLKQFDAGMNTIQFNKLMLQNGFLEQRERPSSKGTKKFWSITEKGLAYGKNLISPQNQKETQPHYFESTFVELLTLLGGDGK